MSTPNHNSPCPCGSGKNYKDCCLTKGAATQSIASRWGLSQNQPAGRQEFTFALERKPPPPKHFTYYSNLGDTLFGQGNLDAAIDNYRKTLELKPDFVEVYCNLGFALHKQGNLNASIESYRKALLIKPDFAGVHSNLGLALQAQGELEAAVKSYHKAIALKPDFVDAHYNLGIALKQQNKLNEAAASYRQALSLQPDFADAHYNLGNVLQEQGRLDEAAACFRKALSCKPDFTLAYSNLLFLHSYHALIDPLEYLSIARDWEQACIPAPVRQEAHNRKFKRLPLAARRLRVGYVSGDFRQHAVSYFIEPIFAHHDKARIELFAYSTQSQEDEVTDHLRALAEHWIPLMGISDAAVRNRIEADNIDVLIDLSGHTKHNRLGVFARRAAPVQAYYLGYFASTGLTEMDYWIGDKILTPPETDCHFSEQVLRLPRVSWCYDGKDAPLPNWTPDSDGTVWLGSFNQLGKLTPATLSLWAQILHSLPEGRLLLKAKELADATNRRRILDAMLSHGISADRIELQDWSATPNWASHMAYYNRLDIVLDPVGAMGGVTTTCDALWMGAPVVTLLGNCVTSRATASIISAIDHPEWIVNSEAEYISKVVTLARDVELRNTLRFSQRTRMFSSPLCNAKGLAMSLENAYFEIFNRWQDKQHEQA